MIPREVVQAILILAGFSVGAFVARLILSWAVRHVMPKHEDLRRALSRLTSLLYWAVLLFGVHEATKSLTYTREHPTLALWSGRALAIAWIVLAVVYTSKFFASWLSFRERQATEGERVEMRDRNAMAQKLVTGSLIVLGGLSAMRVVGADIAPFLAGGAVGGLVLGLALQESLSNVFAGIFLNADKSLRIGDLVRLENGKEGFIENIGWRNTKIRLWDQTLLVIPNNTFSKQSFTNLAQPILDTTLMVDGFVAFDTDLDRAEVVMAEVAEKTRLAHSEGSEALGEPSVRWNALGENGVGFRVFIPLADPLAVYVVRSEFIKELLRAFQREAISIPYPTRHLIHSNPN